MDFPINLDQGCYIGIELSKEPGDLLTQALEAPITLPEGISADWKRIETTLKKAGFKKIARPKIFILTYIS